MNIGKKNKIKAFRFSNQRKIITIRTLKIYFIDLSDTD